MSDSVANKSSEKSASESFTDRIEEIVVGIVVSDPEEFLQDIKAITGISHVERTVNIEAQSGGKRVEQRLFEVTLGPMEMELIEVLDGEPPHKHAYERTGEGINHINLDLCTGDRYLDAMLHLKSKGVEPYWGYPGHGFCYFKDSRFGNVNVEIMRGSGHAGKKGFSHLGLVVNNLDDTVDYFQRLFAFELNNKNAFPMVNAFYNNEFIDCNFGAAFFEMPEGKLEVIAADSPIGARLDSIMPGAGEIYCLYFKPNDYDDEVTHYRTFGFEAKELAAGDGEKRHVFLETVPGGLQFGLIETGKDGETS